MNCKYKKYVDFENILIEQEKGYRYSLFIPYKNSVENTVKNKTVLVIMRNPSKADLDYSDRTTNNVLAFCNDKYNGVYITNLYPYYETDSKKVKKFINSTLYDKKMKKNYAALKGLIKSVDDVIVAWGTNKNIGREYKDKEESAIGKIFEILEGKDVYAMRFESSENPWHPLNWEKNFRLQLYKF